MGDCEKWYLCDPGKNTACRKKACLDGLIGWHGCFLTNKPECARLTGAGERIVMNVFRQARGFEYEMIFEGRRERDGRRQEEMAEAAGAEPDGL